MMILSEIDEEDTDGVASSWLGDFRVNGDDMNRLVMNYLLTEGYKDAAEKFRDESGVSFTSTETEQNLDARIQIRSEIVEGKVPEAIELINELTPELLDDDRYLHFRLLQQQLIELVRLNETDQALAFAQEHLAEKGEQNPKCLEEIEKTLSLLAFDKPQDCPFGDLMEPEHRQQVANEVNSAILKAQSRNSGTSLESLIKMVLWAQDILDKKHITYPKMTDIGEAKIEESKNRKSLLGTLERHRT